MATATKAKPTRPPQLYRAQRFRLYPTREQEIYFRQCAGASRHAWNWALALRRRYYRRFGKQIPLARMKRQWSRHKRGKKLWASGVSKVVTATALCHLDAAYTLFFSGRVDRPRFKSRHRNQPRFTVAEQSREIVLGEGRVRLPVIGRIRFRGRRRWPDATIRSATVRQEGERWFLSILFELSEPQPYAHTGPTCGIDLGCTTFATVASEGVIVDEAKPPRPYAKTKRRLKRLQRRMSRRKKDGKNRDKTKRAVSVMHWRITNIRNDFLHKLSRDVVNTYSRVGLEDLCVKGMARGHVRKSIADLGLGEFRRQVEYKATETGAKVVIAPRFYPSSKMCSTCGLVNPDVVLGVTHWKCACGEHHNRDHNAAINLEKLARGTGKVTPAETGGSSTKRKPSGGAGRRSRNAKSSESG